ncbi:DNA polymerase III subunit delta' [Cognatilysobacter bugurensis]|uniref:DNA-directed DNA polymerase n=1 Tax=Cognatilysobacter bugurensis TaxID=543356 RepID=A0A918W6H3_9GAMM|nr:DNA polymerase III subunit delta' [Lysobacter bugurensis]GHA69920.1 DNA polymerase III subunit delta' [Lysobacter bugurensis]
MTAFAPWQQRMHDRAAAALDAGRLGHGLLFAGPARLGKRAVAERLAQRVLCLARPPGGDPCGVCRGCRLFAQRHQRDPVELRGDGSLAQPFGHSTHPDFLLIGLEHNDKARPPKMRGEIVIEQMRRLGEELALTPQFGEARVAIIDPADAINHAACNALLKTLEEPVPGRYLWLVSAHPVRLPATVRSRCQRLEFTLPAADESLQWLLDCGFADSAAREALEAARGHPGIAREWLEGDGLALRREVAADLQRIARGEAGAVEVAQRWIADGQASLRLVHAADLAAAEAAGLTDAQRVRSLGVWFDHANRVREQLRTTVRADLAVVELLMAWRSGVGHGTGGAAAGGRRR